MTRRSFALGKLDLAARAARVDEERVRKLQVAKGDHDRRTEAEYVADLTRATETSLRGSPSWRAGQPLSDGERWKWTVAGKTGMGGRP